MSKAHNLTIIWLLSAVADMASTYWSTPDLKHEANWFVVHFGLKWPGLLLLVVGFGSLFILLHYYHTSKFGYRSRPHQMANINDYYQFHLRNANDSLFDNHGLFIQFLRVICNAIGFFAIRLEIVLKFFYAFGNTLNGFSMRYYSFTLVDTNAQTNIYDVVANNSPFAKDSIIEKLIIHWVLNEYRIENSWLPVAMIPLVMILIYLFLKKEKARIDHASQSLGSAE
jgi:hypothetical protein